MNVRTYLRIVGSIILVLVAIGGLPAFRRHWEIGCGFAAVGLFLVTARHMWEVVVCVAIAMLLAAMLPRAIEESDPFHEPVAAQAFVDAPLPKVLQFLSKQRTSYPWWHFDIYEASLATSKVSVTFREHGTLGEALESVCEAANCKYRWHWFKMCGNAPHPSSAVFQFWPANQPEPTDYLGGDTHVWDNSIFSGRDAAAN